MLFYHTTFNADAILQGGFQDATGRYLTDEYHTGVWLADRPLDANEGADGDTVLVVSAPEDALTPWEWVCEDGGASYREFLAPAAVVNAYLPPILVVRQNDPEFYGRLEATADTYGCPIPTYAFEVPAG